MRSAHVHEFVYILTVCLCFPHELTLSTGPGFESCHAQVSCIFDD